MRVSLSVEAQADADAAADLYIGEGAFRAAVDFVDTLERAFALLRRFPAAGAETLRGTRALVLHKFPYSLIYRLDGEEIRIIAVAHHSRRPKYWRKRR